MSNSALVFVASVIIIGNFVSLYLFRWVHKNKYKVGDYVYIRTTGGLFVARIDSIVWESNIPDLIGRPTYNVYYFSTEKHACLPESAILCKFKGERLVLNE